MLRDTESKTSIEGHKVDEVNVTALKRYRYRTAICWLFCYVCHVAFCNCVLARARQLPRDEDSEEFTSVFEPYIFCGCMYFGLMAQTIAPAGRLMNGWKLTALALCSIYLIIFDPELLYVSGCLLNFFPSVKSWSLDAIAKYSIWEACVLYSIVAWVPVAANFILICKYVLAEERAMELSLGAYFDEPDNDAMLENESFSLKRARVVHNLKIIKMAVAGILFIYLLLQVFLFIIAYPASVLSEVSGKSGLYAYVLVGLLFATVVRLLSILFCICYILVTSNCIRFLSSMILFVYIVQSDFVMEVCCSFILSTVSLVG
ncbi:FAFR804Cp [Eremothecium gossypii FDAG1]|nr:FAFR804Cp [Eremothecium gossypii FDAG1]